VLAWWPGTVENEVGEHDPPEAAGQCVLDAGAVDVGGEALSAKLS
jgi:hypothetical protein